MTDRAQPAPSDLLQAQYQASGTIYGTNDPVEILTALLAFAQVHYTRAVLALLEGGTLLAQAQADAAGVSPARQVLALQQVPMHDALAALEVLMVSDVASDLLLDPAEKATLQARGVASLLLIPLVVSQQLTGLLLIEHDAQQTFAPDRMRTLRRLVDQAAIAFENRRLLSEATSSNEVLRRQVEALRVINELASNIYRYTDEVTLFDQAAQLLHERLGYGHIGVVLLEGPDSDYGYVAGEYPDFGVRGMRMSVTNEIALWVKTHRKPLLVNDVANSDQFLDDTKAIFRKAGIYSILIAPMFVGGDLLGTIGFDLNEPGATFPDEAIDSAATVANLLSVSVQNLRLLNETRRRAEQMQRIAQFAQRLSAASGMDTVLRQAMTEAQSLLGAERIAITLFNQRREMRAVAQLDLGGVPNVSPAGPVLALSGTLFGAAASGQHIELYDAVDLAASLRTPVDVDYATLFIMPLRTTTGRILGTIMAGAVRSYAFSADDAIAFQQLANQLATAVDNIENLAQAQRRAQNEALLSRITAQLQQYTEIDNMLLYTVRELSDAIGAQRARVQLRLDPPASQEVPPRNGQSAGETGPGAATGHNGAHR